MADPQMAGLETGGLSLETAMVGLAMDLEMAGLAELAR